MSRVIARSIPLLFVLGSACSDGLATLPSAEPTGTAQAAMGTNPPGQVQHIQALADALTAAWAAKDAAAYAAPFAEDVEFIGPTAVILSGREAIRVQHAFLFGPMGPFRQSTQTLEIRRIEFLTGTIALVDLNSSLTGFLGLPPGLRETEPGVVRNIVRWVVVKHRGEWQIQGQQMTPVPPPPMP
jgi:uncharacterized protein (TIGR02246 family)